jgi:hypothetical protein
MNCAKAKKYKRAVLKKIYQTALLGDGVEFLMIFNTYILLDFKNYALLF